MMIVIAGFMGNDIAAAVFSEIDRVETITFLEKELKKIERRISEEEVQANLQNLNMLREDKSSPQAES